MSNVLLFVEQSEGKLRSSSLPAITFGQKVAAANGGKLYLLLIGGGVGQAAGEAASFGAAEVLVAESAALGPYLAETYAPIVAQVARDKGASIIAGTATSVGKDLLPRVAGLVDAGLVADVVEVSGANRFRRPMQAGNVIGEVESTTATTVVTVRQTAFEPAAPSGGASPTAAVAVGSVDTLGAEFVSIAASKSERPDLTEAKVVISGGRGMREGKNFEPLAELADLFGGAMGASRAACDAGMVPNDLQVGQTGKVVAPQLYIAVAISGAIQHLAGMKGSKVIVAINKDAEAPIFQVADYGLVTTWEKALPELIAAVKQIKAS